MRRDLSRSNAHFRKAARRLPLGVSSNFRYWGDEHTIYVKRGKGARLWDIDGNEYIDYRLAYGPIILGYGHDAVDEAARAGQEVGSVFALGTEAELRVAERIHAMVPGAELVRFSNSGTEAVMAALRLARGYTGKDSYVLVEGSYHGLFDAAMWTADMLGWDGQGDPLMKPYSAGVPRLTRELFHQVSLNDIGALERLFKAHGDTIAAVLIEPIQGNTCAVTAEQAYLEAVRSLCSRHGVVLIVDEVKTGFRVGRGGVQELFGIAGDLMTFAKAMGNGYPIAAVAGREDIMRRLGRGVAHGGTYTAQSMALAACEKTLEILDETAALADVAAYGRRLQAGVSDLLARRGIPHCWSGHPAMGGLFLRETAPRNYREWKLSDYTLYDALALNLIDCGVLVEPDSREPWFICAAHDQACLNDTLDRFETALGTTLDALGREDVRSVMAAEA